MTMQKVLAFVLCAACLAADPRLLQSVTTTPAITVTTTPATTVTTTPGASFATSFTMSSTSRRLLAGDRRLSTALTSTQVVKAACVAFSQISSVCSATASQALSGNWAIVATITTTASNAAFAKQSLDLLAVNPLTLATNMKNAFVSEGALSAGETISCTGVTVASITPQPYVASSYPAMTDKPFKITFFFTNGVAALMNVTQLNSYNLAVVNAFVTAGLPSGSVGAGVAFSGTTWGANCSVYPVATATNTSTAVLQYIQTYPVFFGELITAQLKVLVPSWTTTLQISSFTVDEFPTFASATGINVTINGSIYTGLFGEGGVYDLDDSEEQQSPAMSGTLALPIFGVFGLFTLVSFIGMGVRRKQSEQSTYTRMHTGFSDSGVAEHDSLMSNPEMHTGFSDSGVAEHDSLMSHPEA